MAKGNEKLGREMNYHNKYVRRVKIDKWLQPTNYERQMRNMNIIDSESKLENFIKWPGNSVLMFTADY